MFIIRDWAGNRRYPTKEFKTFEDGQAFLMDRHDRDIDLGEYWVEEDSNEEAS